MVQAAALALLVAAAPGVETFAVDPAATEIWFEGRATQADFDVIGGTASGWIAVDRDSIAATGRADLLLDARAMRARTTGGPRFLPLLANIRRMLEPDRHPPLRFRLRALQHVRPRDDGFEAVALGDLTIRGVTRPATTVVRVRFDGDEVKAEGEFPVRMSDFHIRPPRLFMGMLRTNDDVLVRYRVAARRAGGSPAP
jgi:polyisoprenoid-binding protein YceI